MVEFPFERGKDYSIQALCVFEELLSRQRQTDKIVSNRLRLPTDRDWWWVKTRHEELIPLLYCVRHGLFGSSATFRLMPSGDLVDLRIKEGTMTTDLQVTVADPIWGSSDRKGSQHHLLMEALNTGEVVSGFGPFKKGANGNVLGHVGTLAGGDFDRAYGNGLSCALKRKSKRGGAGQTLLIFCRTYEQAMDDTRFLKMVYNVVVAEAASSFDQVWFVNKMALCGVRKKHA